MDGAIVKEAIDAVVEWRRRNDRARIDRPLLPLLQSRFKLTPVQAIEIIRKAGGANEAS